MSDTSGQQWDDGPQHWDNFIGTAQAPLFLPYPKLVLKGTNITILLTNLTATVFKNGVATALTAVIDGTNTQWKITEQGTALPFSPGDTIDVRVTTDGAWLPTANNLDVSLYIG